MRAGAWVSVDKGMCSASRALEAWCAQDLVQFLRKDGSGYCPGESSASFAGIFLGVTSLPLWFPLQWHFTKSRHSVARALSFMWFCLTSFWEKKLITWIVTWWTLHENTVTTNMQGRDTAAQAAVLAPLSPWHRVIWRGEPQLKNWSGCRVFS